MKKIINTIEFTRLAETLSGALTGSELERVGDLLLNNQATINWSARGEQTKRVDGGVENYLGLSLSGSATMTCLRCLEPFNVPILTERQFRFARDEAHAAKLDAEDELVDAIVGSARFDLGELIEDEIILLLPFSPKHEHCEPPQSPANAEKTDEENEEFEVAPKLNPFQVLSQLKKPNP